MASGGEKTQICLGCLSYVLPSFESVSRRVRQALVAVCAWRRAGLDFALLVTGNVHTTLLAVALRCAIVHRNDDPSTLIGSFFVVLYKK